MTINNPPQLIVNNPTVSSPTTVMTGSGGGGSDWGMRIERLESDVKDIKSTLQRLEPMLAAIDERLKHIPNMWTLFGVVIASVLAAVGIALAVVKIAPDNEKAPVVYVQQQPGVPPQQNTLQ